ncbi:MAG: DnaB-like helicase C-terminal domain-containing protein, partial [Cyanobacteria bacterium J06641_2]
LTKEIKGKKTIYTSVATSVATNPLSVTTSVASQKKPERPANTGLNINNKNEVSPSVATSVATSDVDISSNPAENTTKCRHKNDSSSSGSNLNQNIYKDSDVSPIINSGDGDSGDTWGKTQAQQALEGGDSCKNTGDSWSETHTQQAFNGGDSYEITGDTSYTDESETVIKDVLVEVYEQIEQRHEGVALPGIPSGFYDLDAMTCGFGEGDLIVLASRPTHGTTALALNIAQNVTELSKLPVAFFSLQHSRVELVQRMLSAEVEIESSYLKTGRVSDAQWEILSKGIDSLSRRKLNIFDSEKFRIKRIQEQAEKMSARRGVIIIDNLDKIHDLTSASAYT